MKNTLIVFFIVSFFVLILVFPFKTRVMGHINLLEMKCYYCVKTWIIKLLCGKIILEDSKIKMTNEKTILSQSYNSEFVKGMTRQVLEKLDIKKIEIFFTGGFKENSFSSAIMCGSIISLVEMIFGFLSLRFDDVKMFEDIKPTFDEDNLELTFDLVVSISLIKLVISLFEVDKKLKKLKEEYYEG